MGGSISSFSADYRDGTVQFDRKKYPAGSFCVSLLNDFNRIIGGDTILVHTEAIRKVSRELQAGYLNGTDYMNAKEEILYILSLVKRLKPFDVLDDDWEKLSVSDLFTEEKAEMFKEYFRQQSLAGNTDPAFVQSSIYPPGFDRNFFSTAKSHLDDVCSILDFYDSLVVDICIARESMEEFASSVNKAVKYDEAHLLPIALEVFEPFPQTVRIEYISRRKSSRSSTVAVARRMYFNSYASFIITDLFEGIHHGHYPRRCELCGRYFLMTTARRTRYCNGFANELFRGKKITCRALASQLHRKEHAEDNPVIIRYTNRCGVIRVEEKRGRITKDFAAAAKALAKEHKQLALSNPSYAESQYIRDMEHDKLYHDTKEALSKSVPA